MAGAKNDLEVLHLSLGALVSLDVVRKRDDGLYLMVLAENGAIRKRQVIRLYTDQAHRLGRFLLDINTAPVSLPGVDDPAETDNEDITPIEKKPR